MTLSDLVRRARSRGIKVEGFFIKDELIGRDKPCHQAIGIVE